MGKIETEAIYCASHGGIRRRVTLAGGDINIVERWELASADISSNEEEIKVLGLFDPSELLQIGPMENWSEHIINGL